MIETSSPGPGVRVDDVGAGTAAEPRRLVGLADEDARALRAVGLLDPDLLTFVQERPRHDRRRWRRLGPGPPAPLPSPPRGCGSPHRRAPGSARADAGLPRRRDGRTADDGGMRRRPAPPPPRRRSRASSIRPRRSSTTPTRSPTASASCWPRTGWLAARTAAPGPTRTVSTCCTSPRRGGSRSSRSSGARSAHADPRPIAWCIVGVLQGIERETRYRLVEAGGRRHLEPIDVVEAHRGHVEALIPPADDIHLSRPAATT